MNLPEDQQIYRYWIELRDLRDCSVRVLPLRAFKLIHLTTRKGRRDHGVDWVRPRSRGGVRH